METLFQFRGAIFATDRFFRISFELVIFDRVQQRNKDKKEQTNDQGKPLYSEQDKVLADRMVRYWTNFAKES